MAVQDFTVASRLYTRVLWPDHEQPGPVVGAGARAHSHKTGPRIGWVRILGGQTQETNGDGESQLRCQESSRVGMLGNQAREAGASSDSRKHKHPIQCREESSSCAQLSVPATGGGPVGQSAALGLHHLDHRGRV